MQNRQTAEPWPGLPMLTADEQVPRKYCLWPWPAARASGSHRAPGDRSRPVRQHRSEDDGEQLGNCHVAISIIMVEREKDIIRCRIL